MKRSKKKVKSTGTVELARTMNMTKEEWIALFNSGKTREQIAKELNTSKWVLRKIAEKAGIVLKPGRRKTSEEDLFKDL